ncbi:hypothetical protein AfiDRAFT_1087 [Afipia sp. 1NLS2]|nr:hypothetical protein AfiDRAFT_1087 [Afipia sp. 1NLS2]
MAHRCLDDHRVHSRNYRRARGAKHEPACVRNRRLIEIISAGVLLWRLTLSSNRGRPFRSRWSGRRAGSAAVFCSRWRSMSSRVLPSVFGRAAVRNSLRRAWRSRSLRSRSCGGSRDGNWRSPRNSAAAPSDGPGLHYNPADGCSAASESESGVMWLTDLYPRVSVSTILLGLLFFVSHLSAQVSAVSEYE